VAESGTSFAIDLAVKQDGVASAADQLDQYAARLDAASKAAVDASAAVKAGDTAFRQAESTYDRASKALERVNASLKPISEAKHTALVQAVAAAKAALDGEASTLDKLRTSAAAADKEVEALTQAQRDAKKASDEEKKSKAENLARNEQLASSLGKIGGPLGAAGQKAFELKGAWDKMSKAIGVAGPYIAVAVALVAVAAAIATVAAASAAAVVQVAAWAVGLADAARTNTLLAAGMVQSTEGGEDLSAVIDDLNKQFPLTREEVSSMAAELAKTGLRGEALFSKLTEGAEKAAKAKFGPEWQLQMQSLEQQQKRLKAGFNGLFSGLKIDSLLSGMSSLVDLFDESAESGKAIKVVFESLFQPVVDGATGLIPVVRAAFLQFEILALKALIAIKPWGSTIVTVAEVIAVLGGVVLAGLAVALGAVIGLVAAFAAVLALPFVAVGALVAGVVYLGSALAGLGKTVVDALAKFSLVDMGKDLIAGLAAGVTSGAGAVVAAVEGAASNAILAAKKALGIASPSKVFAEIGMYTGEGMQQGVERSSDGVQSAMTDLATPALERSGSAPAAPAPAAAGGGNVVYITIQAAAGTAEDIAEKVRSVMLDVLEGAAVQVGTAVPA
jgi:hypothetical protein